MRMQVPPKGQGVGKKIDWSLGYESTGTSYG